MWRKSALLSLIAAVGFFVAAAPAYADDVPCSGSIGAVEIDDNVVVPSGASCTLTGTRIDGNVLVRSNARLTAYGVRVEGNIQAESHRQVTVIPRTVGGSTVRSSVDGDIQLFGGDRGRVVRTTLGGNLQVEDSGGFQEAISNTIDGDLQAFSNSGGFHILSNRIDGNLQCKSNNPPPYGGGNIVQGNKEDQCAQLSSTPPAGGPTTPPGTPQPPAQADGPRLSVAILGDRRVRPLTRVAVGCNVGCAARAAGAVVLRRGGMRLAFRLRPAAARIPAGERRALGVRLSPRRVRFISRAIAYRNLRAALVVRVAARDGRGGTSAARRAVRLRN